MSYEHVRLLSVKTTKASMLFNSQTNEPATPLACCRQYHARFTNASWKLSGHWSHKTKRPHSNPVTLWPSSFSVAEEVLRCLQKCELLVTYQWKQQKGPCLSPHKQMNLLRHWPTADSITLCSPMRAKNTRATGHTKPKSLLPTQSLYGRPPSL